VSKPNKRPLSSQTQNNGFWNFAESEAGGVELRIDGVIVEEDDAWIYEWFGEQATSPNAFREALNQYKGSNKDLTVWIDSYGGSVFAAAGIYNALKEYDGKVITKVDGKAVSAASVIAMAGDEVFMSPVSLMMIHNPMGGVQGYASDMRKSADVLDVIKDTIINAYAVKTGRPRNKIAAMMDDETYMSANVAVKEGFADGVLYQAEEPGLENVMNFSYNHLTVQNSMDDSMKKFFEIAKVIDNESAIPGKKANNPPIDPDVDIKNKEVKGSMDIKDVTDLAAQLPEIHTQVLNAGATAERKRLKAFDALNGKVDPEYLAVAKYEDGATAEKVFFKAMQEGKMIDAAYVAKASLDAANANKVPGASNDDTKPDEVTGILNMVKAVAKKTLGLEGGTK
jgi:ATP-dependent Clp protease protease subunit